MRIVRFALTSLLLCGLAACVSLPPMPGARPALAAGQQYGFARGIAAPQASNTLAFLDDAHTVTYFQNSGGGGVGLGLLLGPLGAAANAAMIDGVTQSDVQKIKGKVDLNPEAAFRQAATATQLALRSPAASGDVKVLPYVQISKTNDTTLNLSAVVVFEAGEGASRWTRRYQYELATRFTLDELAAITAPQTAALQAEVAGAYETLLKHAAKESDAVIAQEGKIAYKSTYLSPRFDNEMRGNLVGVSDGRVWVRNFLGVYAVVPADISYQPAAN